jgi:hypothetical protein
MVYIIKSNLRTFKKRSNERNTFKRLKRDYKYGKETDLFIINLTATE